MGNPESKEVTTPEEDEKKYGLTTDDQLAYTIDRSNYKSGHIAEQEELIKKQEELINIDHLTGLENRRSFDEKLSLLLKPFIYESHETKEQRKTRKTLEEVSLISIDLDHFKLVNDTFGHQTGDEVLRAVGALLKKSVRAGDVAARFGGEELAVLMNASVEGAAHHAEKLRDEIQKLVFSDSKLKITASFGITSSNILKEEVMPPEWDEALRLKHVTNKILRCADEALYAAKHGDTENPEGRDCVRTYKGT